MMKILVLFAGLAAVLAKDVRIPTQYQFTLQNHDEGGFDIMMSGPYGKEYFGHIGRRSADSEAVVDFHYDSTYDNNINAYKISVSWTGPANAVFEDCISFGNKQWFAGPEQKEQLWPIQKSRLKKYSIVSKEEDNAAVGERYWLNSAGEYIYVAPEVPLFVDYHNVLDNHICLIAEVAAPYSTRRKTNNLKYDIWIFENAVLAHQHAVSTYLGKPSDVPDYRMIQYPIWSTWARYSRDINQENLMSFASEILSYDFPNAQFEIDDLWEICYGSLTVNQTRFPNFKEFIQNLKRSGFRVTIWMHPFINKGCEPWYSEALDTGYLVLNEEGSPDTTWWNNNDTVPGYIDFTKPEAATWFTERARKFINTYDIDSIKFDAGESSFSPQIPVQDNLDINLHPGHIVQAYVRKVAEFGAMIEVRSGMRTQDLPVFIRMVDKDTVWGYDNGLATLVTTLLSMNLNGYTLVLPDMIGGNGYNEKPSKELFIRWLQANVFMPSMQYSFVPWDHDDETVELSRHFTSLHAEYADTILAAMDASVAEGTPVNPPIWWLDPNDQEAMAIDDEFLLGLSILAAPVLKEGAVTRDIYLPTGIWKDGNNEKIYQGPVWLKEYPAPLDTLPYFVLVED